MYPFCLLTHLICCTVHHRRFALSAAVEVAFEGEHYVHSVVFHKFSNSAPPRLSLIARARQFSSFILLVSLPHMRVFWIRCRPWCCQLAL